MIARSGVVVLAACLLTVSPGAAQTAATGEALAREVEARFEVLPVSDGVVLRPRASTNIRSVEVSGGTIAVDGRTVTGAELRERLGADADLVLRLSYLDDDARRQLFSGPAATSLPAPVASPASPAPPTPPQPPAEPTPTAAAQQRPRPRGWQCHDRGG
jgi:hypothetical protein